MMPKPICLRCKREMDLTRSTVIELHAEATSRGDLAGDGQGPYQQWQGDVAQCGGCGAEIVFRFGGGATWQHFNGVEPEPGAVVVRERTLADRLRDRNPGKPLPVYGIHLTQACRPGRGEKTCAFLIFGGGPGDDAGAWSCAKGSSFETPIREKIAAGEMRAKGDNCTGAPGFYPNPSLAKEPAGA